jgi:hypothetical protein
MANTTHTVITTGGGDYTTLSAYEDAIDDTAYSAGETATVNCSGTDADTTAVTFAGWDADVTIEVVGDYAVTSGANYSTSYYRLEVTTNNVLSIGYVSNVHFTKIQMKVLTSAYYCIILNSGTNTGIKFKNCVMICANTTGHSHLYQGRFSVNFINCIAVNPAGYGANDNDGFDCWGGTTNFWNCTIYGFAGNGGIFNDGATAVNAINTICNSNADNYKSTITTSYCCSDIVGELSGTGDRNGTSGDVTFVAVSTNFHLDVTDVNATNLGTDNSANGYTDDIDGVTRTGTWDIGADEYVAAGGARRIIMVN